MKCCIRSLIHICQAAVMALQIAAYTDRELPYVMSNACQINAHTGTKPTKFILP